MKYLLCLLVLASLVGCAGQSVDSRCTKIYTNTEADAGQCYK